MRFYRDVLGLKVVHSSDTVVGFETGSFCLYLEDGPGYGPVFEFLVENVDVARQQLMDAGCRVEHENPSVPRCYMRDPFGLVFNLAQHQV